MKTIFITISRGSLIRNFFQTGFISKILRNNIRVVVLSPHYKDKQIFEKFYHKNLFFEPLIAGETTKLYNVLMEFYRGIIFSNTVIARYKYKYTGRPPRKILYYPRIIFFYFFRFFPGVKAIIRKLDFALFPQKQHDYLFKKYKPDLVFVTDFMNNADVGVLKSAKRYKVRTYGMPKSWDNFPKSLFRVKTDKIFVWGDFCKDCAIKYQNYNKDEIVITGVLQFDYYKKDNLMSREEFCESIGLDKNKKIIFYGSTGARCQHEYEYVDLLLEFINIENINAQILIRPHLGHRDDDKKFDRYKNVKNIAIYKNKQNMKFKDTWDISDDHLKYLYNSIYHSDVSINIASTLTLDSVAIGTPVININFDATKKDIDNSVFRFYETDYTGPVTKFGGTWLVKSRDEYFKALKNIIVGNKTKTELLEKMKRYFLYKNDNHACDRLAKNIINALNNMRM